MANELKPCPFCGGEATIEEFPGNPDYNDCYCWSIGCKQCNIGWYSDTKEEAISEWNHRADDHIASTGKMAANGHIVDANKMAFKNKTLTLEDGFEIANADGTPIDYEALGRKYKNQLCYCDIDGFYIGEDGQLVLMDDDGTAVSVDRGDYRIKARKPKEETNAES